MSSAGITLRKLTILADALGVAEREALARHKHQEYLKDHNQRYPEQISEHWKYNASESSAALKRAQRIGAERMHVAQLAADLAQAMARGWFDDDTADLVRRATL